MLDTGGPQLAVGSLIDGTYSVLEFVGQGAMGAVYKVEHRVLNRVLALKILRVENLTVSVWKRFQLEGKAIARIEHPNVIKIYDLNKTEHGQAYYTMEFLSGLSMGDYLAANGRFALADALPIFRQVCSGLQGAHNAGIIHRDIKPGNIMVVRDQPSVPIAQCTAKIVDFGIVKMSADAGLSTLALTRPGEIFGTPFYMSPEQCAGGHLDQRSDIYSLGVTFFQALTGEPPLLGRNAVETTLLHHTAVPLSLNETVGEHLYPAALEDIIARMLEKAPEDRFASMAEVEDALHAVSAGGRSSSRRTSPQARANSDSSGITHSQTQTRAFKIFGKLAIFLSCFAIVAVASISILAGTLFATKTVNSSATADGAERVIPGSEAFDGFTVRRMLKTGDAAKFSAVLPTDDDLTLAQKYLATAPKSYLQSQTEAAKIYRFPDAFSLGKISGQNGFTSTFSREAQGEMHLPRYVVLKLDASPIVFLEPKLVECFAPSGLDWFAIDGESRHSKNLTRNLSLIKSLQYLELKNCDLVDSNLPDIEKLEHLKLLDVRFSSIDGYKLAKCRILKQLKILCIDGIPHVGPVLKELVPANNIEVLSLNNCILEKSDFSTIARMKKMTNLYIRNTSLTDQSLAELTTLDLVTLNIIGCDKLSVKSANLLKKFRHMKDLKMPTFQPW